MFRHRKHNRTNRKVFNDKVKALCMWQQGVVANVLVYRYTLSVVIYKLKRGNSNSCGTYCRGCVPSEPSKKSECVYIANRKSQRSGGDNLRTQGPPLYFWQ